MQPAMLALLIALLPLLANNAVYLLSAQQGYVPWCIPYIDGCTTISQAARSGDSIYVYRAVMMVCAVLQIWFWSYAKAWLDLLHGGPSRLARIIMWLGIVAALFLVVYIDFLGTSGEVNRFMRRYGILIFFTFTPLAQLLMLKMHYELLTSQQAVLLRTGWLRCQLVILGLMLMIGIASIVINLTGNKTYVSENIVEWNFSILLSLYYFAMTFIWKGYRHDFKISAPRS